MGSTRVAAWHCADHDHLSLTSPCPQCDDDRFEELSLALEDLEDLGDFFGRELAIDTSKVRRLIDAARVVLEAHDREVQDEHTAAAEADAELPPR